MAQFISIRSRIGREGAVFSLVAGLVLAASLASLSHAQDETPAPAEPAAAAHAAATPAAASAGKGSQIFHTKCIVCHNKQPGNDSPFGPPNLYDAFKTKAVTPAQAEVIITHGKGQMMPSFASVLSKADIQSVIVYLRAAQ